jgi:hypothetical protein
LAAIGVVVLGYLPVVVHELGNNFSETRAAIAFLASGGQPVALSLPARLLFVGLRVLAWPLEGLLTDHLAVGVLLGVALIAGFAWRMRAADEPERGEVRFLGATLVFGWLVLGVGVGGLATVTPLPVDHYHAFLDPIVFIGAGLTIAGLWRSTERTGVSATPRLIRALAGVAVAALEAFNLAIAPPAVSPDGGWLAAVSASHRILTSTGNHPIELRGLPAFKAADAYGFPLVWFHAQVTGTVDSPTPWTLAAAASASGTGAVAGDVPAAALASNGAIVTICHSLFIPDCGGLPRRPPCQRRASGSPIGSWPHPAERSRSTCRVIEPGRGRGAAEHLRQSRRRDPRPGKGRMESRTPGPQSPAFAFPETRKWREIRVVSLGDSWCDLRRPAVGGRQVVDWQVGRRIPDQQVR